MTGSLVSADLRSRVRDVAEPVARGFGRLGLTPNHLTLIGFGIAIVAAIAAAGQSWLAAGVLVLVGGAFDLLDGALARATNRVNRLGAFMDSVFDRWGESVVYVGIAWGALDFGLWLPVILTATAMASAFMVSYTRTKSEGLGFAPGTRMANVGIAPREVRIVLLALGLTLAGLLPGSPTDTSGAGGAAYPLRAYVLDMTLALITVLATITTIQRIVHVLRQSEGDSSS